MTTGPLPMCFGCTHLRHYPFCDAYPGGIPVEIATWQHDHREPFPGDQGVLFEPTPEVAEALKEFDGDLAEAIEETEGVDLKVNKAAPRHAPIGKRRIDLAAGRIKRALVDLFVEVAKKVALQVAPALAKAEIGTDAFDDPRITSAIERLRNATDEAERETIRAELRGYVQEAMQRLDLGDWGVLIDPTSRELEAVTQAAGMAAIEILGISDSDEAGASIVDQVNERALAFAQERAAELVGMRQTADGWIPNPNPKWAITESTRGLIASDIVTAIEEGWSTARLAEQLAGAYAFSAARAETIARTETNRANNVGNLIGYRASGVVLGKLWLAGNVLPGSIDDLPCPICRINADAGVIPIDDPFPSGADSPPQHPNCRCAVAPVTTLGGSVGS